MNNILQTLKNMSPGRLASIAAVIIFLISFFVYLGVQMNSKEYGVLYTDLELEDAKQIIARLETANVKYKLVKNGTEIMVPVEDVNRMRVDTAELALSSKGANVGYEVFDNTDALGSTNFVQNVNLIRALEGELARTIRSVDNIKSARVHLVMPKREMFSREEQVPTASVVIKTREGQLDPAAVQSIQKLVAAAVPKLDVKNVSIVDTVGNLLTEYSEEEAVNIKNTNNELLRLEQERKLAAKVQDLVEKTVGAGHAQAQVTIEMDFDEVVTNEELYDPDGQVVRSQATITENGISTQNTVPVTVAQNIPNGDTVTSGAGISDQNSKTEETINYEISKIVRNKVKNTGTLKRLTVGVIVDGVYERNAEGKLVYRPRTAEEMEKITALVKSAVGYDANRGDLVEVENLRFASFIPEEENIVEEILYMGFTKAELLRMAEGLGVAIIAILVILLVIRPLINNVFEPASPSAADKLLSGAEDDNLLLSNFLKEEDEGSDELINLNKVDGRVKVSSLKKLNTLIEKNPEAAVNVLRGWLYNNDN